MRFFPGLHNQLAKFDPAQSGTVSYRDLVYILVVLGACELVAAAILLYGYYTHVCPPS